MYVAKIYASLIIWYALVNKINTQFIGILVNSWPYSSYSYPFTPCSSVSIINFEQVDAGWAIRIWILKDALNSKTIFQFCVIKVELLFSQCLWLTFLNLSNAANIHLFKVQSTNTRKRCEIQRHSRRSVNFIVNFEQVNVCWVISCSLNK